MQGDKSNRLFAMLAALATGVVGTSAAAQDYCAPSEVTDPQALHINGSKPFIYKTVGTTDLRLHVFTPGGRAPGARSPAAVFFYGGGFLFGDVRRFQTQATHLALRGMVTVLVDYRVRCRNGSTVMDSVSDGKSAMRWVRGHAGDLGIDPARIAAVGSSAGGQIAAATALLPGFDDPEDPDVDPRPNALVLYNPALDLAGMADRMRATFGKEVAARAGDLSPLAHLDRGKLPPTIIYQGDADVLTPIERNVRFCDRARALRFRCELIRYPGAPHGFTETWAGLDDPARGLRYETWQHDTDRQTDRFFVALGWLRPDRAAR